MKNPIVWLAAGLLVAVSVHVVGSASAAGTAGASTSRTKTRIHLTGTMGPGPASGYAGGRFTLVTYTRTGGIWSGAVSDRGTFVDRFQRNVGATKFVRTLRSAKGMIWVKMVQGDLPGANFGEIIGRWRIIKGTSAYAGLRGQGRVRGRYLRAIDVTMTGILSR